MSAQSPNGLRYAIIGAAAGIATTHLAALAQIPGAQIIGMADIAEERGAARAAEYHCPFFSDHQVMLAELKPDVAVITTPHPFHAPLAIESMQAGAHVLVEKPLAVEVAAGDAMNEAADRTGKILAVSFQQRFRPAIEHAKQLISAGELGDLVRVLMIEPWYRTAAYYQSASWRGTWKGEGGGVLMNQGPHPLDLLCHLAGQPVKVWGWARTRAHAIEVEDSAQAMLEFANGAPGYLNISTVEAGLERRLQIAGERAALELVGEDLSLLRFSEALSEHRATNPGMWASPSSSRESINMPGDGGGHVAVYRDLEQAIRTASRPRCDGREAMMSLELANAITLSSELGRPVELPLDREAYHTLLLSLQGL